MSRPRVTDAQEGFGGGLNTTADESQLQPNELRIAANFLLTEYGAAVKRGGSQHVHADALGGGTAIQGGFAWRKDDGTVLQIVIAAGHIYTFTYGTFPVTVTDHGLLVDPTNVPDFVAFRGATANEIVYIADGGLLCSFDGTTFTRISGTPAVARLAIYNQRLFGITGADEALQWSDLNNGDSLGITVSGGGEAIIRTFGDQILTQPVPMKTSMLLFHESGISIYTGWTIDDINIAAGAAGLTGDVGTVAPRTAIALENEVLFLSERGFYSTDGVSVAPISTGIDVDVSVLTAAQLGQCHATHFRTRREVWFYVSTLGIYVFNYRLREWSGPQDAGYLLPVTTDAWEAFDNTGQPIVMAGDALGFVKRVQMPAVFLDNVLADGTGGTSYEAVLQMHRLFCGGFENTKSWRWGYLLMDPRGSSDVSLSWATASGSGSYDIPLAGSAWGEAGTTWGMGVWGGAGVIEFRVPISGTGNFVDVTLRDNGNAGALYSRFSLEGFDMGRRG